MQRRAFTAGLGVLLASAGAAGHANADFRDAMQQAALRIRFDDGAFQTINGFEVGDGQRSLGLTWSQFLPIFNEVRFDLSGVGGGIGELFRTPFRVRWGRALPIGNVDLVGNTLIGRVADAGRYANAQTTVGAGNYSWDLPARLSPVSGTMGRGRSVGGLRVEDSGRLLVLLNAAPAF